MKWTGRFQRDHGDEGAAEEAAAVIDRAREMGRILRDARLARGLSLGDIEQATRINRLYLEALEGARFEVIPAPVYARGFMRSYARYLGMDPETAVDTIPKDLPRPAGLEPMPGMRRTAPPALPAIPAMNAPLLAGLVAVAVLVVAALYMFSPFGGDGGGDSPIVQTQVPGGAPAAATVPPFETGRTPNFIGVPRAEAERVLRAAGATPLIVEAANAAPAGTVFNQDPEPGAALADGAIVTLYLSQGQ